jgi:hypothetical protein
MGLSVEEGEIKRAVRRLDAKNNPWFHESLNEPLPDTSRSAAEIFGEYFDKMVL